MAKKTFTKEELQDMLKEIRREENIDKYRERIRRQNQSAKTRFDALVCKVPKGMKEEITSRGYTINGLMRKLLEDWIEEQKEKEAKEVEENTKDLF